MLIDRGMCYIPNGFYYAGGTKDRSAYIERIIAQEVEGWDFDDPTTFDPITIANIMDALSNMSAAGYSHATIKGYVSGKYYIVETSSEVGDITALIAEEQVGSTDTYNVILASAVIVAYGLRANYETTNGESYVAGAISYIELAESKGTALRIHPHTVAFYYDKHDLHSLIKDEKLSLRIAGGYPALAYRELKDEANTILETDTELLDLAEIPSQEEGRDRLAYSLIVVAKMHAVKGDEADDALDLTKNVVVVRNAKNEVITPTPSQFICLNYQHEDYSVTILPLSPEIPDTNLKIQTDFRSITELVGIVIVYSSSVTPTVTLADKSLAESE